MATSLIINKTTTAMKSNQKSIPNIADTASDYDCANFATHLIEDLSTDTVDGVYRVQKTDITDASTPKPTGTITLSPSTATVAQINALSAGNSLTVDITYNRDGQLYMYKYGATNSNGTEVALANENSAWKLKIFKSSATTVEPSALYVKSTETDNYTAAEATFTITEG